LAGALSAGQKKAEERETGQNAFIGHGQETIQETITVVGFIARAARQDDAIKRLDAVARLSLC